MWSVMRANNSRATPTSLELNGDGLILALHKEASNG